MSSLNSAVPFDSQASTDSEMEKDEICGICGEYCMDYSDLEINFLSCWRCVHSYHKRCIPNNNNIDEYFDITNQTQQ